jgi:hypothetical protein
VASEKIGTVLLHDDASTGALIAVLEAKINEANPECKAAKEKLKALDAESQALKAAQ